MPVLLDHDVSPTKDLEDRLRSLRNEIDKWIDAHVEAIRALGLVETTRCAVGGRRFAGYECFDCDFKGASGEVHVVTVSACFANQLADPDAQVVDAVSALTLLGMLLDRLGMKATISPNLPNRWLARSAGFRDHELEVVAPSPSTIDRARGRLMKVTPAMGCPQRYDLRRRPTRTPRRRWPRPG